MYFCFVCRFSGLNEIAVVYGYAGIDSDMIAAFIKTIIQSKHAIDSYWIVL